MGAHFEVYPGGKKAHFRRIHEASGVAYEDMLFFDNESWNVREVGALGVVSVYTPKGMTGAAWREGLAKFAAARGAAAGAGAGAGRQKGGGGGGRRPR